jgi:antitoxin ParD1/3/4
MGKNTSIILGEYYEDMIKKEMENGKYSSASEMIREGLRLLEERSRKIEAINKALVIGEKSGKPLEYNYSNFLKKMAKKHKVNA